MWADVWVRHTYVSAPGSWPGRSVATWLLSAGPLFLLPTAPLLTLWFPDGHAPPGRWRRAELAPAAAVILLLGVLVFSWPFRGRRLLPDVAPIGGWSATVAMVCAAAAIIAVLAGFVVGFTSLISRLRHAEGVVRAQVKWFLLGVGAAFVLNVTGDFGPALAPLRLVAVVVLELFIAVAIERYRLWEIDRLINRTVVYGTLTLVVAIVYASAAISIGLALGGAGARSPFAVAGATLLIAVLFAPLRRRFQAAADRRFDRRAFDAVARVQRFAERMSHESPEKTELPGLLSEVLRDPELVLCFTTADGGFIDVMGATVLPPTEADHRAVTTLGSRRSRSAFLAIGVPSSTKADCSATY